MRDELIGTGMDGAARALGDGRRRAGDVGTAAAAGDRMEPQYGTDLFDTHGRQGSGGNRQDAYAASIPCGAGSGKLPRAGTKELRGAGLQRRDGGLDRGFFERREDHACGAGASAQTAG